MQLQTTLGLRRFPEEFGNQWAVVFFYTGDFLPVSTTELQQLAGLQSEFGARNAQLLALSTDSLATHLAYLENLSRHPGPELKFPLGTWPEQLPKTILILGPDGAPKSLFQYPPETGVNFTEVLRTLAALQTGRPTPAGWVPGAGTLLPPPETREQSQLFMQEAERQGHICIDWYLCFENNEGEDLL